MKNLNRILFVCLALAVSVDVSLGQETSSTNLHGTIYFYDASREPIPYPYPIEQVKDNVIAKFLDYETAKQIIHGANISITEKSDAALGSIALYSVQVPLGDASRPKKTVRVEFDHGPYSGHVEEKFIVHVGELTEHLRILRIYESREKQIGIIKEFHRKTSISADEEDSTFKAIFGLINEDQQIENFLLLVNFFRTVLAARGEITQEQAQAISAFEYDRRFANLAPAERFRVLADLGYVFARAPALDQAIMPGSTYRDFSQFLYALAIEVARQEEGVGTQPLARALQEKYSVECDRHLKVDCFQTLYEFATFERQFNTATLMAVLGEFATQLEKESEYGKGLDVSEEAFIDRIASNDELVEYWARYRRAASSPDIKKHIEGSVRLMQVLKLSESIYDHAIQRIRTEGVATQ